MTSDRGQGREALASWEIQRFQRFPLTFGSKPVTDELRRYIIRIIYNSADMTHG